MSTVACSECLVDQGLRLDAEHLGEKNDGKCPLCGSTKGAKLDRDALVDLAQRFFVWGSFWRTEYGGAPRIQFNEHQKTCIAPPTWLQSDIGIFEKNLGVGFFHYGPRMWMIGEVEPLKSLQEASTRQRVIDRIVNEYPKFEAGSEHFLYRVRKDPKQPDQASEYDSPPATLLGKGRLDAPGAPVLYASPDIQVCVHECRFTAEDELFVATLHPAKKLTFLDLSVVLDEGKEVTEFESLDMAVYMVFLARAHSYDITRAIAAAAKAAGLDGIIYPSYFSLLRTGVMPLRTAYGLSHRRIPQFKNYEQSLVVPNIAVFGHPIESGVLKVKCINKMIISRVAYDFHFGPVSF